MPSVTERIKIIANAIDQINLPRDTTVNDKITALVICTANLLVQYCTEEEITDTIEIIGGVVDNYVIDMQAYVFKDMDYQLNDSLITLLGTKIV